MYEFISPMISSGYYFVGSNPDITHAITLCLPTVLAQALFLLAQIASNYSSNWPRLLYFTLLQEPYSIVAFQTR